MTAKDGYREILERLAGLQRKAERLQDTLCVCGHEWHQHTLTACTYRQCACEWFVAATT